MSGRFEAQVAKFGATSLERYDRVRRASILELFSLVIDRSPVDTGRFRGNWQTTVGSPAQGTIERLDRGGDAAKAEVLANLGALFDVVCLTNNLAYSEALEDGYSAQAPAGMVGPSVVAWPRIVAAKARAYAK